MMKDNKPMDDYEIVSYLGRKILDSMNDNDGEVSDMRTENLNYYLGEKLGDERNGYSEYVDRSVLESVEWALPHIMRVFCSTTRYVEFVPETPEDEEQARKETDQINHILLKTNEGFMMMYDWIKDILINPNGYVRADIDERERYEVENYSELMPPQMMQLVQGDDVEVVDHDSKKKVVTTPGGKLPIEVFDITLKRHITKKRINVECVEPEQVLIDPDLTDGNLDNYDNSFIAHRVKRTFTWLVEAGFDREKLDEIGGDDQYDFGSERVNRLFYEDENPQGDVEEEDGEREFWVHDCNVRIDVDGDGLSEQRRIILIGDTIFLNEEDSYQPFVAASAIRHTHKHIGMSYVELVKDIQKILSILKRQLLNNLHRLNIPRKYVGSQFIEDDETIEALLDITAEMVPCKDPTALVEENVQPIFQHIMPVIEQFDEDKHMRTGVSPNLQLDPDVLQKSNNGVYFNAMDQMSARLDLLVRLIAECGVKKLALKIHRLMRENPDMKQMIKVGGQWQQVDPSGWREREDMTVNVGLGFDNRNMKVQILQGLLAEQKEAVSMGLSDRQKIFNLYTKLMEELNIDDVNQYFVDPKTNPDWQPQPDAVTQQVQNDAKIEQMKLQLDQQQFTIEQVNEMKQHMDDLQARYDEMELKYKQNAEA